MATLFRVIAALGPKLVYDRTASTEELAEWMARSVGLRPSQVAMVLRELHEAILDHARRGVPIHLEGIGRIRPAIRRDGRIRIHLYPDRRLVRALAELDFYHGEIRNRGSIGLSDEDFKRLWDEDHPEDPLILTEREAA